MTSYRPIDSKREEFRKYLEKAGAMDALTKVLVMLYDEPEKPADALDYIRRHLVESRPEEADFEVLKADLEAATLKVQSLEDEVKVLREKLLQYEPEEKESADVDLAEAEQNGSSPAPAPLEAPAAGSPAPAPEAGQ